MKRIIYILFLLTLFAQRENLFSQEIANKKISGNYKDEPLKNILQELENRLKIQFNYLDQFVADKNITASFKDKKLSEALKIILEKINLSYKIYEDSQTIVLFKTQTKAIKIAEKFTISGFVEDEDSGEKLNGANVFDAKRNVGTTTNRYGFFSLTIPSDSLFLMISHIGYKPYFNPMLLREDKVLTIQLIPTPIFGDTLKVEFKEETISNQVTMSKIELSISEINSFKDLTAEMNILKTSHFLSESRFGNKDSNGLFIRGGSPDQNLVLLDGTPVYNSSHFLGLFPIFNPDALKNVTLTKGGFPARYGGRISSIMEINTKEGNNKYFSGSATLGFISSGFSLEGPVVNGKSSFIFSARRTYVDKFSQSFLKSDNLSYLPFFYDLNAKINYSFSPDDRIFFSFYNSQDKFSFEENTALSQSRMNSTWYNRAATFRWNHIYNKKLFSNTTITHSNYDFNMLIENNSQDISNQTADSYFEEYKSKIEDWSTRIDFDYLPNPDHTIRLGGSFTHYIFNAGTPHFDEETANQLSVPDFQIQPELPANEFNAYIEDEVDFNRNMSANIGLHTSFFTVNKNTYSSFQPRISVRYKLGNRLALKSSYTATSQYFHLLSNNHTGLPTDMWLPVTNRFKPLQANQIALGIVKEFREKQVEMSLEAYSKTLDNLLTYNNESNLGNIGYDSLTTGTGYSHGLEFFVQKKHGNTTGFLNYQLSWTNKNYAAFTFGQEFPYRYDNRHLLSISFSHSIQSKFVLSANWTYGTGDVFSIPPVKYVKTVLPIFKDLVKDEVIYENETKRLFRTKPYHRLDIKFQYYIRKNKNEQKLTITIFNIYNRKNPYFLNIENNSKERLAIKQVGLFPFFPVVSYSFIF